MFEPTTPMQSASSTRPFGMEESPHALDVLSLLGLPHPRSALLFGCASGDEAMTARSLMPEAHILAVDINEAALAACTKACRFPNITIAPSDWAVIERHAPFDMLVAHAVFCRHSDSVKLDNLTRLLRFDQFESDLGRLVSMVRPGGVISVRDSNYPVALAEWSEPLIPVSFPSNRVFGVQVERFGRDGLKYAAAWNYHIAGAYMAFRQVRPLPLPFLEAMQDRLWIKGPLPVPARRFKVEPTPPSAWNQLPVSGRWVRNLREDFVTPPDLMNLQVEREIRSSGERDCMIGTTYLVNSPDGSELFRSQQEFLTQSPSLVAGPKGAPNVSWCSGAGDEWHSLARSA